MQLKTKGFENRKAHLVSVLITRNAHRLLYNRYRAPMFRATILSFFVAALSLADDPVSFHKQIRPILARQCLGCHQGANAQAGLSLATVKDITTGGRKGPALAILVAYLTGESKPQMPFGAKPLPDDQIDLFRRWIREGAKDDSPAGAAEEPVSKGPTVYHAPPVI